jgi:hypothetical protein
MSLPSVTTLDFFACVFCGLVGGGRRTFARDSDIMPLLTNGLVRNDPQVLHVLTSSSSKNNANIVKVLKNYISNIYCFLEVCLDITKYKKNYFIRQFLFFVVYFIFFLFYFLFVWGFFLAEKLSYRY